MFRFTMLGKRPPRKGRRNSDSTLFAAQEEVEEGTLIKLKELENTVQVQEERIKILEHEMENLPQLFHLGTGVSSETSKGKKYYTINQERPKSIIDLLGLYDLFSQNRSCDKYSRERFLSNFDLFTCICSYVHTRAYVRRRVKFPWDLYWVNKKKSFVYFIVIIINKVTVTICRVHVSMILTSHDSFRLVQSPHVLVISDSWKCFHNEIQGPF